MAKYRLLYERVREHAERLGIVLNAAVAVEDEELISVHDPIYVQRVIRGELSSLEQRRIGFPWSSALIHRSRCSAGATLAATRAAIEDGVAVNLAGGTHHAFTDRGQGYCVFNDVAVSIRMMQLERRLHRAVVIDCDVHQGNGTASIFADDPAVFTFSVHGEKNFPFAKVPSDLDLALPDRVSDDEYLRVLGRALSYQLPLDACELVLYLAGADPYIDDRIGRMGLTKDGLSRRDELVIQEIVRRRIPLVVVMAGGYADDVNDIVDIHFATVEIAAKSSLF